MTARTSLARVIEAERPYLLGWAVILLAVAVRVGWAAWVAHAYPNAVASGDTPAYLGSARALLDTGEFNVSPDGDTPMFLRTPGYPLFLAAILRVTDSVWSISPIQAALTLLTVVLVVLVGRRVMGPTAGVVAGVLVALDPLQFAASGTILTESLAAFTLVAVVAAGVPVFVRRPEHVRVIHLFGLGALIAVATMVRPTTYYFPIVVVVLVAVRFWGLSWRSKLALLLAFAAPIVLVVGGWMVRNHYALDSWQVAGSAPVTLYCWHAADVQAQDRGETIQESRRQLGCHPGGWDALAEVCPSWWECDIPRPLAHGPSWDEMGNRGIDILTDHPVLTAEMLIRGFGREVAAPGTDTVARFLHVDSSPPLAALLFLWNLLLWSLAVVGAVAGLRSPRRWFWGFVITSIAYVLVVSAGANAAARFRSPVVPLIALLAAMGIRHLVNGRRRATAVLADAA